MSVFNEYGRRIEEQIRPKTYPLAVKMLEAEGDIPEEAERPKRDFGACMSTCQCFALSRRFGATIAQLFEDMWCPEPVIGFGLAEPPQYFLDGHNRYPDGVETLEAGANWARELPRFEAGRYVGVASAPLSTASFEPDVAVIYCDSAQLLRLLLGIAYRDGRDIATVLGGHVACVYAVVPAMLRGACQAAVPCRGDRGRAGAQDDEMIFSVPRDKIGDLVLGLEQGGTSSIPTRFSMKAEYMLSPSYAEMARLMGMRRADGSEIKGYTEEERRLSIEYK
ncbi:hypothetical protein AC482_06775 [miscellaneous Crenarchaeota group-15 archaeon DG-45]|uniref:DUF169 domain-containing protein n=1 Tax=miscellaneous Crenarchaeota group-15 archaeon DG-45 TaxID=1685127 RepID=A0A0M0BLA5_9ARCH|nr:MAG: hypothetical protein AC482_06775 [miscellaneous Crenarchaeota group-15 archaeon DG-45]